MGTAMRTFTLTSGKSNKFWNIELQGSRFTVQFGKLGSKGQTQLKDFADEAAARKAHDKLVAEKLAKGYVEIPPAAAPAASSAPTTTAPRHAGGRLNDPQLTALLEACWENLDDHAPWLVLADWLEEHGEAARADITRLEVALNNPLLLGHERGRLSRRKQELLAAHQCEWLGPALTAALDPEVLESCPGDFWVNFCGGWLWELGFHDAYVEDVPRIVKALTAGPEAPWLTRLVIHDICGAEPDLLEPLASCPHLGRLAVLEVSCPGQECAGTDVEVLFGSSAFPNLRRLALTGTWLPFDPEALAGSGSFPRLQSLNMDFDRDRRVGAAELRAFANSPYFPDLRELILCPAYAQPSFLDGLLDLIRSSRLPRLEALDVEISEIEEPDEEEPRDPLAFARALASIPEAARLRKLRLTGLHRMNDDLGNAVAAALAASLHWSGLTTLDLADNRIGDAGAAALAASPHLRGLTTLNLTLNPIGVPGLPDLVNAPHLVSLNSLTLWGNGHGDLDELTAARLAGSRGRARQGTLDLAGTNLPDEAVRALAESPHLARFTTLDLHCNRIGDAGARALAESPHLARLTTLDLSFNQIGVAGMLALATSPHLPQLTSLNLEMNSLTRKTAREAPSCRFEEIDWESHRTPSTYLALWYNQLGDQEVRELAASPRLMRFTALSLQGTGIGDEAALALAASPHLVQLTFLDLSRNQITARGVTALLDSPHLRSLVFLGLRENKIYASDRKRIRAGLRPSLSVWMEE
jgi:uncharacterized protein (TIGR02996 family)